MPGELGNAIHDVTITKRVYDLSCDPPGVGTPRFPLFERVSSGTIAVTKQHLFYSPALDKVSGLPAIKQSNSLNIY